MLKKFIATILTTIVCLCTTISAFAATFEVQWETTELTNLTTNGIDNFGKLLASKPPIKNIGGYLYYFPVGTTFAWEVSPEDKEYYDANPSSYNLYISYSEYGKPVVNLATGAEVTLTSDMFGEGMLELHGTYIMPFMDIIVMNEGESPSSIPTKEIAIPTSSNININGTEVSFNTYNEDYFKLRDLAYSLNGTEKQFEISWDSEANAINLLSNKSYTVVGSEMAKGDGMDKPVALNNNKILLDGEEIQLISYIIDGNNYFRLHDIGELLDFSVVIDTGVTKIDTSIPYTE